jgi:hypothetical protein
MQAVPTGSAGPSSGTAGECQSLASIATHLQGGAVWQAFVGRRSQATSNKVHVVGAAAVVPALGSHASCPGTMPVMDLRAAWVLVCTVGGCACVCVCVCVCVCGGGGGGVNSILLDC